MTPNLEGFGRQEVTQNDKRTFPWGDIGTVNSHFFWLTLKETNDSIFLKLLGIFLLYSYFFWKNNVVSVPLLVV